MVLRWLVAHPVDEPETLPQPHRRPRRSTDLRLGPSSRQHREPRIATQHSRADPWRCSPSVSVYRIKPPGGVRGEREEGHCVEVGGFPV